MAGNKWFWLDDRRAFYVFRFLIAADFVKLGYDCGGMSVRFSVYFFSPHIGQNLLGNFKYTSPVKSYNRCLNSSTLVAGASTGAIY